MEFFNLLISNEMLVKIFLSIGLLVPSLVLAYLINSLLDRSKSKWLQGTWFKQTPGYYGGLLNLYYPVTWQGRVVFISALAGIVVFFFLFPDIVTFFPLTMSLGFLYL